MRGDRPPAAPAERDEAFRLRIRRRAGDGRMRLLIGLDDVADADLRPQRLHRRDGPVFSLQVDRRGPRPQRQDVLDRLREHGVAVDVEKAERLGIRAKHAGADPEDEAAFEQIVEHGRVRGHHDGMAVRQIDHRGPDFHLRGHAEQRGDEHHAVGNVLGRVGEVLAAIAFAVSEPVGENEGFAILLERLDIGLAGGWTGIVKKPSFMRFSEPAGSSRRRIVVLRRLLHKSRRRHVARAIAFDDQGATSGQSWRVARRAKDSASLSRSTGSARWHRETDESSSTACAAIRERFGSRPACRRRHDRPGRCGGPFTPSRSSTTCRRSRSTATS